MINEKALLEFVTPYYENKDIMHDMWHIGLVIKTLKRLLQNIHQPVDEEALTLAAYFHGFIYSDEQAMITWLSEQGYEDTFIEKTLKIAWGSQRNEVPETLECKLLHDAHVLEGGKAYLAVKTLITGSVRGQSLKETLEYMQKNVLDKNRCYLKETIPLCDEMNAYTNEFYETLVKGIE